MQGYFGNMPVNILKSVSQTAHGTGYTDNYSYNYSYQIDDDGYPTLERWNGEDGISISHRFTWSKK